MAGESQTTFMAVITARAKIWSTEVFRSSTTMLPIAKVMTIRLFLYHLHHGGARRTLEPVSQMVQFLETTHISWRRVQEGL